MSSSDTHKSTPFVEKAAWFVLGLAVVATLQAASGWWLNSGTGVLRTVLVLGALGVLAALWRSGRPWVRARALWAGAISGSATALAWIGPGNLWPIALAVAGGIIAGAVFGGTFLGCVVTRLRRA